MSGAAGGAIGGYVGARYGPGIIRRRLDRERTADYLLVLLFFMAVLVGCALLTALCLVALAGADPADRGAGVLVTSAFALVVACTPGPIADVACRWWWRGRRPNRLHTGVAPSGVAATVVGRSRVWVVRPIVTTAAMAAYTLGILVLGLRTGELGWAAPFGAVGAFTVAYALPLLLGRARTGGLYLTADGIEHRFGTVTGSLPWTYLPYQADANPFAPPIGPGGQAERSFPWDVFVDPTDRAARTRLSIPRTYLDLVPTRTAGLINTFVAQPQLWRVLGTDEVLHWTVASDGFSLIPSGGDGSPASR